MQMISSPNWRSPAAAAVFIVILVLLGSGYWFRHEAAVGTNRFFFAFEGRESLRESESRAAAIGFTKVGDCKYRQYAGRPPITDYTDCKFLKNDGDSMEMSFYHGQLQRIEYSFDAHHYPETLGTITKVNGNSNSPAGANFLVWNSLKRGRISLGKTADGTRGHASVEFDLPELDQQMKDLAAQVERDMVLKPLPISTVDLLNSYRLKPKLTHCWGKNPDGTTQCDYRAQNHDLTLVDANGRLMRASIRFDDREKPQRQGNEEAILSQIADFVRNVTGNPAPAPLSMALRDLDIGDAWSIRDSETVLNGVKLMRGMFGHDVKLTIYAQAANEAELAQQRQRDFAQQKSQQNLEELKTETDQYCMDSYMRYGSEVGKGLCDAAIDSMVSKVSGKPSAYDLCMMGADAACEIANEHMSPSDPRWNSLQSHLHHF
jgi:hypothetical protein